MSTELAELFARDPLKLTKDDIRSIVERMRQAQAQYELGIKTPVAERKKRTSKGAEMLNELGLGAKPEKSADDLLKSLGLK